jgi:exopolysaccharide biosynthesis protein YbjH/parallel beta helix pectate lyase-like protein
VLTIYVPYASAAILRVPHSYATIQAGIAAASAGDTVLIAPGVYFENVSMKPGVHIQGEPGAILDGSQGAGAVVSAASGVELTAVLSGFVVRRGQQAGIFLNQAAPTLRNNVIIENAGPGIDCAQASPSIVNNAIVANAGGGIVCQYPGTAPVITYNVFWQNQPADVLGCTPGIGNRYEDPGFVNASQGNYRLRPDSPLINAGDPDPALHDRDGSRSDIGAYGGPPPRQESPRASVASSIFEELFGTPEVLRNSLSASGLPGIIHVPTATTVPDGSLDVGYNTTRDPQAFPGVNQQKNFNFAFGFLPRLTIGGRGTVATDTNLPNDSSRVLGNDLARDISANAQFLLLEDKSWWPSIAVGLQDIGGGAAFLRSGYVTLSKTLFGRLRGTFGVGTGPDVLKGPFAGAELALNRFVTLLGEYDADAFNAGVRLFPLPEKWEAYGIPRPTVDVIWQEGGHVSWGISFRSVLGEAKYQAQREARAGKRYSRPSTAPFAETSLQIVSERLQAELLERGLENVRITIDRHESGLTVVVEYENRRYNRDELDALGLVLGLAALRTPPAVTYMRVIVHEVNIPVLEVSTSVEAFLAFVNEQMSAPAFAQQLRITQEVHRPLPMVKPEAQTDKRERSWLKLDVFLRPGIETQILTEVGVADMRFTLFPDAFIQLTPGTVVNVRAAIPVTQTSGFPGELGDPDVDRVLLHQAVRLPLGTWSRWATGLTQLSIGRFSLQEVGIADETALTLLQGVLFAKGTLARVGSSFSDLDRTVALANGRVRYPPWDLTLSVTAGRFLDGDRGVAADLSRFFGNTEIGVFFRHTDNGSQAGLRFAVPLTLDKELPPWRVRPRLPDLFPYEQSTTVLTDVNVIRGNIGRPLRTGHDIERVYWNRDRLYPVYIRQHVDTLKQAVRKWIDETS